MATKPTIHAEWAIDDLIDPINSLPNKQEPSAAKKLSGSNRAEPTTRQNFNWLFNFNDQWNKYAETAIDEILATLDDFGRVNVLAASDPTLTKDQNGNFYPMTGTVITLANVTAVGGGVEQIGSVIKVRTTNSTTVTLDAGVTSVGFSGSIPADRVATFTIESLPAGNTTEWAIEISAGV